MLDLPFFLGGGGGGGGGGGARKLEDFKFELNYNNGHHGKGILHTEVSAINWLSFMWCMGHGILSSNWKFCSHVLHVHVLQLLIFDRLKTIYIAGARGNISIQVTASGCLNVKGRNLLRVCKWSFAQKLHIRRSLQTDTHGWCFVRILMHMADVLLCFVVNRCWHRHCLYLPGPRFNIKMSSYQYRKSHCGDKTVVR